MAFGTGQLESQAIGEISFAGSVTSDGRADSPLPIGKQSPGCCWLVSSIARVWALDHPYTAVSNPDRFQPAPRLRPTEDGGLPDRRAHAGFAQDHRPPAGAREHWYQRAPMLAPNGAGDARLHVFNGHTPRAALAESRFFPRRHTAARMSSRVFCRPPETTSRPSASRLQTRLSPA